MINNNVTREMPDVSNTSLLSLDTFISFHSISLNAHELFTHRLTVILHSVKYLMLQTSHKAVNTVINLTCSTSTEI